MTDSYNEDQEKANLYHSDEGNVVEHMHDEPMTLFDRPLSPKWRRARPYVLVFTLLLVGFIFTHGRGSSQGGEMVPDMQPQDGSSSVAQEVNPLELEVTAANAVSEVVPMEAPDQAIVLSSYRDQDTSWLSDLPPEWHVYRYLMDDASLPDLESPRASSGLPPAAAPTDRTYTVPRNQGREAMAYLTFIIDNYDHLPLFTIFHHGHDRAWHQVEHAAFKVRALNLSVVAQDGYTPLRCGNHNRCNPDKICDLTRGPAGIPFDHGRKLLPRFWKLLFPDQQLPQRLASTQGAQFAVTRNTIRSRSLEFYKRLRSPLLRDEVEYGDVLPGIMNSFQFRGGYQFGLLFEHIWHVIFNKPEFYCPDMDRCRDTTFGGAISCDRYVDLKVETDKWIRVKCWVDKEKLQIVREESAIAVAGAKKKHAV